jgi:hypothetical protein
VLIRFNYWNPPKQRAPLAEQIRAIVAANTPEPGGVVTLEYPHPLPRELDYIRIWRGVSSAWSTGDTSHVVQSFADHIQAAIDEKAPKLPEYLKNCDECWLLIAADTEHPSGFFDLRKDELDRGASTRTARYVSPFPKVFFLQTFEEYLRPLSVVPASSGSQ